LTTGFSYQGFYTNLIDIGAIIRPLVSSEDHKVLTLHAALVDINIRKTSAAGWIAFPVFFIGENATSITFTRSLGTSPDVVADDAVTGKYSEIILPDIVGKPIVTDSYEKWVGSQRLDLLVPLRKWVRALNKEFTQDSTEQTKCILGMVVFCEDDAVPVDIDGFFRYGFGLKDRAFGVF
jgi:hypothetical protein